MSPKNQSGYRECRDAWVHQARGTSLVQGWMHVSSVLQVSLLCGGLHPLVLSRRHVNDDAVGGVCTEAAVDAFNPDCIELPPKERSLFIVVRRDEHLVSGEVHEIS